MSREECFTPHSEYFSPYSEQYITPDGKYHVKDEHLTPYDEEFADRDLDRSYETEKNEVPLRKSWSMEDLAAMRDDFSGLGLQNDKYSHPGSSKYVSMAEAIYWFQHNTPRRFHSSRPSVLQPLNNGGPMGLTIAQSPMLRCKTRSRTVHIMSQKEKEEMEIEEMKKFKIKANPIPKAVIEGPQHLPEVLKKPITKPSPFQLTEFHRREHHSPEAYETFRARPAPKHILEKPQVPPKPPVQPYTIPVSPKFHSRCSKSQDSIGRTSSKSDSGSTKSTFAKPKALIQYTGPVRPEPFSFDKRDEELKRRHEENIRRQIEEEKKQANSFKAQPIPDAIKKKVHVVSTKSTQPKNTSEDKENIELVKFEACLPVVLYKEPFKPVKQVHVQKLEPFELATEKRAVQREKFDQKLREKEEEQGRLRKQREIEQRELDEKLNAELRAKLVHNPKPVHIGAPFVPEKSSAPLTIPVTPNFVRRLKRN